MDFVLEHLVPLLEILLPLIAGLISVPIFGYVKKAVAWIDARGPTTQRVLVTAQTYVLAEISTLAGVALPESLSALTLDHTEALIAAGIAFAVHAGKKAAGANGTSAAAVFLALLLAAQPAQAQVTDSLVVEVLGTPVAIDMGACEGGEGRAYVGDSMTCTFAAVDDAGDPTEATFTVEVSDSSVAGVSMQDDSTAVISFNGRGTVTVYVTADPVDVASVPGRVDDLRVAAVSDTSMVLEWTEVGDGRGRPALYEVRVRPRGSPLAWLDSELRVTDGPCGFGGVEGDGVGTSISCEATGLQPGTDYEAAVRAYRIVPEGTGEPIPAGNLLPGYPEPTDIRMASAGA